MAKSIQYQRHKSVCLPPVPTDWEFQIPPEFKTTADGFDFLIGGSQEESCRLVATLERASWQTQIKYSVTKPSRLHLSQTSV